MGCCPSQTDPVWASHGLLLFKHCSNMALYHGAHPSVTAPAQSPMGGCSPRVPAPLWAAHEAVLCMVPTGYSGDSLFIHGPILGFSFFLQPAFLEYNQDLSLWPWITAIPQGLGRSLNAACTANLSCHSRASQWQIWSCCFLLLLSSTFFKLTFALRP